MHASCSIVFENVGKCLFFRGALDYDNGDYKLEINMIIFSLASPVPGQCFSITVAEEQ